MNEIAPADVREWVAEMKAAGTSTAVIRQAHTILSAVFTTASNDQITGLHPCRGVKTPPVPRKVRTILTPEQFNAIHAALPSPAARLLAELDVESGLRWSELTELRPADFDTTTRSITVRPRPAAGRSDLHPADAAARTRRCPRNRRHH